MSAEKWWPVKAITELKLRASLGTAGGRPSFNDQYETFKLHRGRWPGEAEPRQPVPEAGVLARGGVRHRRHHQGPLLVPDLAGEAAHHRPADPGAAGRLLRLRQPVAERRHGGGEHVGGDVRGAAGARPNFTWRAGLVADRSRNKITEFNRSCFTTLTIGYRCAGETLGAMYGFSFMKDASQLNADGRARSSEFAVNDDGLLVWVGAGNNLPRGRVEGACGAPPPPSAPPTTAGPADHRDRRRRQRGGDAHRRRHAELPASA